MSNLYKVLLASAVALSLVAVVLSSRHSYGPLGSVSFGGEYQSTTTSTGRFPTNPVALCGTTGGTVGSVVVTGAAAGAINIYNATTSSATARQSIYGTSSIWAINIPVSAVAGNYIFDQTMPVGVLLEVTGTFPTSTITYRCN